MVLQFMLQGVPLSLKVFILLGMTLMKIFLSVLLGNSTGLESGLISLPVETFFQLKDLIAKFVLLIIVFFYNHFKVGDNIYLNWLEQMLSGGSNSGEAEDALHL